MRPITRTLQGRFLLTCLASFVVISLVLSLLLIGKALQPDIGEIESGLRESSLAVLAALDAESKRELVEDKLRFLSLMQRTQMPEEVTATMVLTAVFDLDGRIVASTSPWPRDLPVPTAAGWAEAHVGELRLRGYVAQGQRWRVVQWTDRGRVRRLVLYGVMIDLATYLALAFPFLAIPLVLALRTGLAPLRRLVEQVRVRSAEDLRPFELPPYRELQPLVVGLNDMLMRQSQAAARERALIQDSAHALTTPLMAMVAQARALTESEFPDGMRADLERLASTADRTSHMGRQLLKLALIDAGDRGPLQLVAVMDVVRDALAEIAEAAERCNTPLALKGPDALDWVTDETALRCVIENLLSNALRHAPGGRGIEVTVSERASELAISVSDDGPGVAVADRERVFERFVRLSTGSQAGAGLGLSIVSRAVRSIGGRITLGSSREYRGCCFEIVLPRHEANSDVH